MKMFNISKHVVNNLVELEFEAGGQPLAQLKI